MPIFLTEFHFLTRNQQQVNAGGVLNLIIAKTGNVKIKDDRQRTTTTNNDHSGNQRYTTPVLERLPVQG